MTLELKAAVAAIRRHSSLRPSAGIILGSGLGGLADGIDDAVAVPFHGIPGFACSTACGHRGQLILGTLAGVPVVAMAGRLHRYEGWSAEQITFPVRVMAAMGIERLIVSNAAGGVNPAYDVGDIVVIRDHIDLMHGSCLQRFTAAPRPTPTVGQLLRGPSPYDDAMGRAALAAARQGDFTAHCGTYLATLGPNYETRAEYRMMRRLGADVVGMSTVPEVLQAARCGLRLLALSMVSNVARPGVATKADHQEVLRAGMAAEPRMRQIVQEVLTPRTSQADARDDAATDDAVTDDAVTDDAVTDDAATISRSIEVREGGAVDEWREVAEPAMLPRAAAPQAARLQ